MLLVSLWFGSSLRSKPRIRANFRTATLASLCLQPGLAGDLFEAADIGLDRLLELFRRRQIGDRAHAFELFLYRLARQHLLERAAQLVDHRLRGAGGKG